MSPDEPIPESPGAEAATLVSRRSARARARDTTRSAPPEAARGTPSSLDAKSGSSGDNRSSSARDATSIAAVLQSDELTRAHGFAAVVGMLCVGVLVWLPVLDGDHDAKLGCAAGLGLMCVSSLWMWLHTRNHPSYAADVHRLYGFSLCAGVLAVAYYFGFFSPVVVVVTLGFYYFGQSTDRVVSTWLPTFVNASFAFLGVLTTFGVLDDRGLFSATQSSLSTHLFAVGAISSVLALTVRTAGISRRSMRASIERSNEAQLVAHKRGALLAEAQQHLERALGMAVGKPGRHTGRMAGPYQLDVVAGIGAMGEIYAAEHCETRQRVAIKVLQPDAQRRPDLVERFLREGAICRSLKDPHLVEVFDVGTFDDGAPYMVMELLHGIDLAARLRKEGSLPLSEVVGLAQEMALGLAHAHAAGVVHRDLKPVNVFQCEVGAPREQRWKILDFGISKLSKGNGTLTDMGIVGTPGYMSPEQARGQVVDHRSDIFSMGVVLYRALTGRPAFTGADTPQIMFDIVYRSPERPSAVVKRLPNEVDLVMAIALAKDPDDRFQSAQELARALQAAATQSLGAELRARAHAVVRAYPWGQPAVWMASGFPSSSTNTPR